MIEAAGGGDLVLLTTAAMRARRHPRALAGLWAWEAAVALLAAWPVASLVRAAYGRSAGGDAALWAPGGHALLDFLSHEAHGLAEAASTAAVVIAAGALLGLVPMAALLTVLAYVTRDARAPGLVRGLVEGLRALRPMATLLAVALPAQAIVVGLGAAVASGVESIADAGAGEARAGQLEGLVLLAFLAAASAVGVAHDLARAAVVRFKVRGLRAALLGARTLRLAPLALWWSWAWRALAGLVPIVAVAWLANRLGGRGGAALVFLLLAHQAVVAARVALRASWLARALRAVDGALSRVR